MANRYFQRLTITGAFLLAALLPAVVCAQAGPSGGGGSGGCTAG